AAPAASATPAAPASGTYFLQAGAYRVLEDAEALRARIILLGLPVVMQRAEVNGVQVNRVRVGPFGRLDDMNRARSRLGENDIKSAVVRQ
ncbi:SPOR domain-containing protein, partial [Bordetella pertussis]